ncbi:hypothetical protein TEA_026839 [Camellia sinensis var. sinensis]|uniref:non-specific serine/threonine protein kinase n=1 Tax=Camellia sinensis var. sinensis TaxID=542762 RepID=A0A4S4E9B6_CAMSN|nr:hypothetical protein TEA_026839 [Camellia sinensis var. sinensis]
MRPVVSPHGPQQYPLVQSRTGGKPSPILEGEISLEITNLQSLENLNLSLNNLSSLIPKGYEDIHGLAFIDISYNQLQGLIPMSNAFMNASIEALQGNKGLCGNVKGLQPYKVPSALHKHTLEKRTHVLVIVLPFGGALLLLGAFIGLLIMFNSRNTKSQGGLAYKAKLPSANIVAMKKLHPLSERVDRKDFLNEARALTEIKHRNIVKLFGYCSHARRSFLVYEYLERGSLATIFNKDEEAKEMDWPKRVNIIKGVASPLSYMHHDCTPPIVHRHISSNNVLIDEDSKRLQYTHAPLMKMDTIPVNKVGFKRQNISPFKPFSYKNIHLQNQKSGGRGTKDDGKSEIDFAALMVDCVLTSMDTSLSNVYDSFTRGDPIIDSSASSRYDMASVALLILTDRFYLLKVEFIPKFSVRAIWQRWRESYPKDGTKVDDAITVFTGVSRVFYGMN